MRRLSLSAAILALALTGCASSAGLEAGVISLKVGAAIYCEGITEEARQAVRDRVSGGVKVIPCKSPVSSPGPVPEPLKPPQVPR